MTQMLDCNLTESVILRNFYKTARLLNPVKVPVANPAQSTDIAGQTTQETQAPVELPVAS